MPVGALLLWGKVLRRHRQDRLFRELSVLQRQLRGSLRSGPDTGASTYAGTYASSAVSDTTADSSTAADSNAAAASNAAADYAAADSDTASDATADSDTAASWHLRASDGLRCERMVQGHHIRRVVPKSGTSWSMPSTALHADVMAAGCSVELSLARGATLKQRSCKGVS